MPRFPAIDIRQYRIPLTTSFRDIDHREGLLLQGPSGWGEFAPFSDYGVEQDAFWLAAAFEMMTGQVPKPLVATVPVNAILAEQEPAALTDEVHRVVSLTGAHTVKMKVGSSDTAIDLARVAAVRTALDACLGDANGAIRLDVNCQWSVATAAAALTELMQFGIEYVEQPCATVAELEQLRDEMPDLPIAVDELLRRDRDFAGAARVADVAVLKVAPLGGGREVLRLASELGLPIVISSAMESSIGLSRDACVAAALSEQALTSGLSTAVLHEYDVVSQPLIPRDGQVPAQLVQPDPATLAERTIPPNSDWLTRLAAAWDTARHAGLVPAEQLQALQDQS